MVNHLLVKNDELNKIRIISTEFGSHSLIILKFTSKNNWTHGVHNACALIVNSIDLYSVLVPFKKKIVKFEIDCLICLSVLKNVNCRKWRVKWNGPDIAEIWKRRYNENFICSILCMTNIYISVLQKKINEVIRQMNSPI